MLRGISLIFFTILVTCENTITISTYDNKNEGIPLLLILMFSPINAKAEIISKTFFEIFEIIAFGFEN